MAGCSKKQYAIMMSAGSEGKKLASEMGGMEQEEFNKAFSDLLGSDSYKPADGEESYSQDKDEDYGEFDADSEDDFGFDEDNEIKADSSENKKYHFDEADGEEAGDYSIDEIKEMIESNYNGKPTREGVDNWLKEGGMNDDAARKEILDKMNLEEDLNWLDSPENLKEGKYYVIDNEVGHYVECDSLEEARKVLDIATKGDKSLYDRGFFDIGLYQGRDEKGKYMFDSTVEWLDSMKKEYGEDFDEELYDKARTLARESDSPADAHTIKALYDKLKNEKSAKSRENDLMNPDNPKYKGKQRFSITNAKLVDEGKKVKNYDTGEEETLQIIEYIPYGALQDGDNRKLYAVVSNYDGSDSPDIGAIVSHSLESAKEDLQHQVEIAEQGRERYLKRGKWDEGWFKMLSDESYEWDDDTKQHYTEKYGWDFSKPWEEQEHVKSEKEKRGK